jgi:hypothetical protein
MFGFSRRRFSSMVRFMDSVGVSGRVRLTAATVGAGVVSAFALFFGAALLFFMSLANCRRENVVRESKACLPVDQHPSISFFAAVVAPAVVQLGVAASGVTSPKRGLAVAGVTLSVWAAYFLLLWVTS